MCYNGFCADAQWKRKSSRKHQGSCVSFINPTANGRHGLLKKKKKGTKSFQSFECNLNVQTSSLSVHPLLHFFCSTVVQHLLDDSIISWQQQQKVGFFRYRTLVICFGVKENRDHPHDSQQRERKKKRRKEKREKYKWPMGGFSCYSVNEVESREAGGTDIVRNVPRPPTSKIRPIWRGKVPDGVYI